MQEVQPYAGMTMIAALQAVVVLNQATTIFPYQGMRTDNKTSRRTTASAESCKPSKKAL
jgi:hypothetical protein